MYSFEIKTSTVYFAPKTNSINKQEQKPNKIRFQHILFSMEIQQTPSITILIDILKLSVSSS